MERRVFTHDEAATAKTVATSCPYSTESGGTTYEAVITSRGGTAASHYQNCNNETPEKSKVRV